MSQSDTIDNPVLGPWNTLGCRLNSFFTLSLNQQNANGVVVGANIYPYYGATGTQTIFAFRDSVSLAMPFAFELYTNGTLGGSSCSSSNNCITSFRTSAIIIWGKSTIFRAFVLTN